MTPEPVRRRLSREQRRRQIEHVAGEVFAERGYAATRMVDVARAAGVSRQLLLRHFPAKRELFLAVCIGHRDALLTGLAEGMARSEHGVARIPSTVDAWFAYLEHRPQLARLLFTDVTGDPQLSGFYAELRASARSANMAMLAAEPGLDLPPAQLEAAAEFVRSAMTGTALWWEANPAVSREDVVAAVLTVLGPWARPGGPSG